MVYNRFERSTFSSLRLCRRYLTSDGDYSSRVRTDSSDEIGDLAAAFNQMAEDLERVEQLRTDMISNAARELRSPLTNIQGYLEALHDGIVLPTQETLELLQEEALRLTHLVEDPLKLARADAAKANLLLEDVNISVLTLRILRSFELNLAKKLIRVQTELDEKSHTLADRDKITQVIENLIKNALQYTPEGGTVFVRVQKSNGKITFAIENNGPGIDPSDLPLIFERFYRGEKSRSRDYGGTGIGLTIVKELVEAHGGKVEVKSTPVETVFSFALPTR